jgi:hypothetical protein
MNDRIRLIEIKKVLDKAQLMMSALIESHPKPEPGKPPQPGYAQKIEVGIWNAWDKLKEKKVFTALDAKKIVKGDNKYTQYRIDSAYSAILSRWARDGYIEIVEQGQGSRATTYKIGS